MTEGDIAQPDDFNAFLLRIDADSAEKEATDRQLEELTPLVATTLRDLGVRLLRGVPPEEADANFALLLNELLEADDAPIPLVEHALLKARTLSTQQALSLSELKWMIIEATNNPDRATELKHRGIARRLATHDLTLDSPWLKAFDLLVPGDPFESDSAAAAQGYADGVVGMARLEESLETQRILNEQLGAILDSYIPPDPLMMEQLIYELSNQILSHSIWPAEAESEIDRILREAGLQVLKPQITQLIVEFS